MDCRDVNKRMDAFLDRRVDAGSAREIRAHLAECKTCRSRWNGLVLLLSEPEPVDLPAGLRDRILLAVDAGEKSRFPADVAEQPGEPLVRGRPQPSWFRHWVRLRHAGAAAACMLFFLAGWLVSTWWSVLPPDNAIVSNDPGTESSMTVVVSPWVLSSMAQAAAMPAPVSPAIVLASGAMPEWVIPEPRANEPMIRVYQRPAQPPATQPVDVPMHPDPHMLPFVPRHLGA